MSQSLSKFGKATGFLSLLVFMFLMAKITLSNEVDDFFTAASDGDIVKVRSLLVKNPDFVNARDDEGNTALMLASMWVEKEVVMLLISRGADVNSKNIYGLTALIRALGTSADIYDDNRLKVVNILICNGADPNAMDICGLTALIYAANFEKKDIVRFLVESGADINAKDNLFGFTPLMAAADCGDKDIIEYLIEKGAYIDTKDKNGLTALMTATEKGKENAIKSLIERGADLNAKGVNGKTALRIAIEKGYTDIADLLRKHGAKE